MYKEVLSGINNVSIYPVFSFGVFFIFFLVMGIWVLKSKKNEFDSVSNIPLENETQSDV